MVDKNQSGKLEMSILQRIGVSVPWDDLLVLIERCRKDSSLDPWQEILEFAFKRRKPWRDDHDMGGFNQTWEQGVTQSTTGRNDLTYLGFLRRFNVEKGTSGSDSIIREIARECLRLSKENFRGLRPVPGGVLEEYFTLDFGTGDILLMVRFPFEAAQENGN